MYLVFTTASSGNAVSGLGPWRVTAVATNKVTLETAFTGASDTYAGVLGWTVPGALPVDYRSTTVDATAGSSSSSLNNRTTFSLDLTALTPGSAITARVSACNSLGCNAPRLSTPLSLAPPRQKPAEPRQVQLFTESATALRVLWSHPSSDGGAVVTHYRLEWDAAATFDSAALGSDVKYVANPGVDCVFTPCSAIIGALTQGKAYYVRVFAYNAFGYSVVAGLALPPFAVPKTQPAPPPQVNVTPVLVDGAGPARLAVTFDTAHDNGGAETTQYQIEWDAQSLEGIIDRAVVSLAAATALADDMLYARHTTQLVLLSATAYDVRGSFRVAFRGHATPLLPWDVSADALAAALEALEPTGRVDVRRVATGNGFAWFVRFLTQQALPPSSGGGLPTLVVSLDSAELVSAFSTAKTAVAGSLTATLVGTGAKLETTTVIKAWNGFELQTVSVSASVGSLGGSFQLVYDAKKSATLPWNASERAVETELRTLGAGDVRVLKQALSTVSGFQFLVLFLSRLGPNQPLMSCDRSGLSSTANGATLACDVVRTSPGVRPVMNSPLYGSVVVDKAALLAQSNSTVARYEIAGLTVGAAYHVRVSAWNGVGNVFGSSKYSTPARVIAQTRPDGPKDLRVSAVSDTALLATWTPPLNAGGAQVARFDLQLDATTGVAEQQSVQVVSQWSDLDGFFTLSGNNNERSAPIPWDATADAVFAALQALQALQPIVAGVSRRQIALGGVGFEWIVTFTTAAGNVALLTADGSTLRGTDSAITVRELVQGQRQRFASPSLTSLAVPRRAEVQEISIFSASRIDLRGTVTLSFCGATTPPIAVDASSDTIRPGARRTRDAQRARGREHAALTRTAVDAHAPALRRAVARDVLGTTRRRRTAAARVHEHGANRRGRLVSRARVWRHVARVVALRAHPRARRRWPHHAGTAHSPDDERHDERHSTAQSRDELRRARRDREPSRVRERLVDARRVAGAAAHDTERAAPRRGHAAEPDRARGLVAGAALHWRPRGLAVQGAVGRHDGVRPAKRLRGVAHGRGVGGDGANARARACCGQRRGPSVGDVRDGAHGTRQHAALRRARAGVQRVGIRRTERHRDGRRRGATRLAARDQGWRPRDGAHGARADCQARVRQLRGDVDGVGVGQRARGVAADRAARAADGWRRLGLARRPLVGARGVAVRHLGREHADVLPRRVHHHVRRRESRRHRARRARRAAGLAGRGARRGAHDRGPSGPRGPCGRLGDATVRACGAAADAVARPQRRARVGRGRDVARRPLARAAQRVGGRDQVPARVERHAGLCQDQGHDRRRPAASHTRRRRRSRTSSPRPTRPCSPSRSRD
ncbi:hypothetical protein PINS_up012352 [Pythium insidiosum]|nr:hypothetical protein PINS_up012352 [Pythium insidiosum]